MTDSYKNALVKKANKSRYYFTKKLYEGIKSEMSKYYTLRNFLNPIPTTKRAHTDIYNIAKTYGVEMKSTYWNEPSYPKYFLEYCLRNGLVDLPDSYKMEICGYTPVKSNVKNIKK
jgi:hypothetical protein